MEDKRIHILFDDHMLFIDGLKLLLKDEADITIKKMLLMMEWNCWIFYKQTADIIFIRHQHTQR